MIDTTDPTNVIFFSAADTSRTPLPSLLSQFVSTDALSSIFLAPLDMTFDENVMKADSAIVFDHELGLGIPGFDAVKLMVGSNGSAAIFPVTVTIRPNFSIAIHDVTVALRFQSSLFTPVRQNADTGQFEPDPTRPFLDLQLGTLSLSLDIDGNVDFTVNQGITLEPVMIGTSGIVVEADDVGVFLGGTAPPDQPAGTRGVSLGSVKIYLPGGTQLSLDKAFIGNGGFTGQVTANLPGDERDIGGLKVTLNSASIDIQQNSLVAAGLQGTVLLPYFDKRVNVDIALGLNGDFGITVTGVAQGDGNFDSSTGLLSLSAGPLDFEIDSMSIERSTKTIVKFAGRVKPDVDGITFPSFEVKEASIDTDGHLTLAGGWVDMPKQLSLKLYAFTMELTKFGFGTEDDGRRWIGFSGGVKVVDGFKAGASVKGLRVHWTSLSDVTVSLEGVGLELEIPNAISIKGSVSLDGTEFRGAVTVVVIPCSLTIEGQFVTGELDGTRFFAIFLRGELPAGIPLGATGLAFYGFQGLYAQHMSPDKADADGWYENPDGSPGWYLKSPTGVAQLDKWKGNKGHFAFGAGITLGTFSDNGYEFSGRLLLVLTFPGPTILIDGRANLFKKRTELESGDPMFRAFAVIEPEKSFLLNMDAHYKYKDNGQLMDLHGGAEAYFNFQKGDDWHIYIGRKDPPAKRIACKVFNLFDVNGYFQLTPKQLDVGASWGYDRSWGFSSLNVHLKSMFAMDATISWHPGHFTGSASFSGTAEARAFGRGVGVTVNTTISGDVFEPFHLEGKFWAGINLPWPLPDLGASITLKWEEKLDTPPVLPLPLREAAVEHNKQMLKWPITRDVALFPNNDTGGDLEFRGSDAPGSADPASEPLRPGVPSVPADSRLGLTFSRPIADPSLIGGNPTPVVAELIGNPPAGKAAYTVGYTLSGVVLEKRIPAPSSVSDPSPRWVAIARAQGAFRDDNVFQIAGSWTPIPPTTSSPQANSEQLKLLINARTPFEYGSQTRQVWDTWFESINQGEGQNYPCQPPDTNPSQNFCVALQTLTSLPAESNFVDLDDPKFRVQWPGAAILTNTEAAVGEDGAITRGLAVVATLDAGDELLITPPDGTNEARLRVGTSVTPTLLDTSVHGTPSGNTLTLDAAVISLFNLVDPEDPAADLTPGPSPPGKTPLNVQLDSGVLIENRAGAGSLAEITWRAPATTALHADIEIFARPVFIVGFVDPPPEPTPPPPEPAPPPRRAVELISFTEDGGRNVIELDVDLGNLDYQVFSFRVRLTDKRLIRIAVRAFGDMDVRIANLHVRTPVSAIGISADSSQTVYGPFEEVAGVVTVQGENLGLIKAGSPRPGEFALLELCVANKRLELSRRAFTSLEQLTREDEIFDPQANYRLVVITRRTDKTSGDGNQQHDDAHVINQQPVFVEQAYFHVVGPPGIELPDQPADPPPGEQRGSTGFEDLRFYVKDTVPVIKFDDDNKPIVPRAFYRAYDAAFSFNESSAVEKMYRLARRDLTLRVFDAANKPVVDAEGRVVIPGVRWEREPSPTVDEATSRWVRMVNSGQCRPTDIPVFDENTILGDQKVAGPSEVVLAPEALYQARLVPALLHESFINPIAGMVADGTHELERWILAENNGTVPSRWVIESEKLVGPDGQPILGPDGKQIEVFFVTEKTGIRSAVIYRGPIAAPNDDAHPSKWSDFRASAQFRWSAGAVALQFRRATTGNKITVALDRGSGTLFVTDVIAGTQHTLHGHPVDFGSPVSDFVLTVECVGDKLRVSHAGADPVDLVLLPGSPAAGTIGLRSDAAAGCRFTEIRVDDLRAQPAVAHRLDFITSKYTNFAHHLGSFDDQVAHAPTGLGIATTDLDATLTGHSVAMPAAGPFGSDPIGDDERRAFDDLEKKVIGQAGVLRAPERVEIMRASQDPNVFAFLIRSPEPLRWERTVLTPSFSPPTETEEIGVPGIVKITGVTFGATPADEQVALLVRESTGMGGFVVQWRPLPDQATPDQLWSFYYEFDPSTEKPIADGTQVLVFAGTAAEAPVRDPGTTQRFLAADATSAAVHFAAPGVELRILSPAGDVVHQRQFRVREVFAGLQMRAVRKLDGSGLLLFLPSSVAPPPLSVLRLTFVLARKAGNDLPVLRQAGSESPEIVALDLDLTVD